MVECYCSLAFEAVDKKGCKMMTKVQKEKWGAWGRYSRNNISAVIEDDLRDTPKSLRLLVALASTIGKWSGYDIVQLCGCGLCALDTMLTGDPCESCAVTQNGLLCCNREDSLFKQWLYSSSELRPAHVEKIRGALIGWYNEEYAKVYGGK